ncbi:Gfo/Idh/MocA family oxidoreductase [bacterium]|nr:Gfo/Idh/MocA family oxidoreductase [bacterium]
MIKLGQVGLGAWGKNLFRTFLSLGQVKMVMACDNDPETLNKFSERYPDIKFSSDWKDLLKEDIQAVVVACDPAHHFEVARAAMENGKDLFVEKPITLTSEKAERLVELARNKRRILMVGHIMVYHPATRYLKGFIDQGGIGKVYYFYSTRVNLGKVRSVENALWSFTPHDLSMILYLCDKKPVRVSATGAAYIQEKIEDVSFLTIFFEDGVIANIHTSWLDPHKLRRLTIVGDKKMVNFDDTQPSEKIRIYDKGVDKLDYETFGEYLALRTGDIFVPKIEAVEPLQTECAHFIHCVSKREQPDTDGKNGLTVVKILEAAQISMDRNGMPIELE